MKIITTPIIPVQLYEILFVLFVSCLFSPVWANTLQIGISLSQITMDIVHIFHHSLNTPALLLAAKSYHSFHHKKNNSDLAHGLTTSFWDAVFGTLPFKSKNNKKHEDEKENTSPQNWPLYEQFWWSRFVQLPFPLVGFILLAPLQVRTQNKCNNQVKEVATLSSSSSSSFNTSSSSSSSFSIKRLCEIFTLMEISSIEALQAVMGGFLVSLTPLWAEILFRSTST
eukprot:TRINITY_DN7963_c0_g1_i1.p1 TRINITY_DN7963_c0_g1~~TRINITY_DN7963_c0_g1_i1.p1  ORF type:complete len:226 (+),score=54.59 TRINITY_DN7963_c0_g1_i1:294-971(+)